MKNWIKVLLIVLGVIAIVLIFDYFSDSFNLIFIAKKTSEVVIYGTPSIESGISFS